MKKMTIAVVDDYKLIRQLWAKIFKASEEVMKDKVYVCTEIKDGLCDQMLNEEPAGSGIKNLSLRKFDIVKLVEEAHSFKEITSGYDKTVKPVKYTGIIFCKN